MRLSDGVKVIAIALADKEADEEVISDAKEAVIESAVVKPVVEPKESSLKI